MSKANQFKNNPENIRTGRNNQKILFNLFWKSTPLYQTVSATRFISVFYAQRLYY